MFTHTRQKKSRQRRKKSNSQNHTTVLWKVAQWALKRLPQMKGWIKIHRNLINWEWFDYPEMLKLWLYLLMMANTDDGYKWHGIALERGQLVTSLPELEKKTGFTVQQIRTCLKRLCSTGEITVESTNKYRIITICNYRDYQILDDEKPTAKVLEQTNVKTGKITGKEEDANNCGLGSCGGEEKGEQQTNQQTNNRQINRQTTDKLTDKLTGKKDEVNGCILDSCENLFNDEQQANQQATQQPQQQANNSIQEEYIIYTNNNIDNNNMCISKETSVNFENSLFESDKPVFTKADLEKMFEDFRVAYKGKKRGFKIEFENFVKKNKEWREIVPKLMPALVKMEEWRVAAKKAGKFVPEYAMLQTWINQSRWEVEYEDLQAEQKQEAVEEDKGEYGVGFGGVDY